MDIKKKNWDIELKHNLLSYLYSLMKIEYSSIIIDLIKRWNMVVLYVTLPHNCVSGKISIPMKTIRDYELTDLCIGIEEYIKELLQEVIDNKEDK